METIIKKIRPPHELTANQKQVLRSKAKIILYSGGVGNGKTLLGCYWMLKKSQNPNMINQIMAPTHRMIEDNIMQTNFLDILNYYREQTNHWFYKHLKSKDENYIKLANNSIIRLRPFDDEGKIRGQDLTKIWIDEAIGRDRTYLTKVRFEQIRARLRRGENLQMLITTNPGSKSHFLYKYFIESEVPDREIIYGSIYENPHLPKDYVLDMEKTFTRDELMGKWTRNVGVVYAEFDRELHVSTEIKEDGFDYYLAIDFGVDNPFACLLIGVDHDNTMHVLDEVYGGMLTVDAIPLIQDMIGNRIIHTIVCDNNSPDGANELEEELGCYVQRVKFRHKMVNMGIRMVKKKLKIKANDIPGLIIHPKCVNLIEEFESYIWDRDKDDDGRDRPIKKNDHALDALRYFTTYHNM